MLSAIWRWVERRGVKPVLALVMAPGVIALGVDSAISHFAGKESDHLGQWIPIVFSAAGGVLLGLVGLVRFSPNLVRVLLRVVGGSSALVGLAGVVFHLIPMVKDLQDESLTFGALMGALSVAPPVFAPAAFTALGGLLFALASPAVVILLRIGAERQSDKDIAQAEPEQEPIPLGVVITPSGLRARNTYDHRA
jgi:hypothetical protein